MATGSQKRCMGRNLTMNLNPFSMKSCIKVVYLIPYHGYEREFLCISSERLRISESTQSKKCRAFGI